MTMPVHFRHLAVQEVPNRDSPTSLSRACLLKCGQFWRLCAEVGQACQASQASQASSAALANLPSLAMCPNLAIQEAHQVHQEGPRLCRDQGGLRGGLVAMLANLLEAVRALQVLRGQVNLVLERLRVLPLSVLPTLPRP